MGDCFIIARVRPGRGEALSALLWRLPRDTAPAPGRTSSVPTSPFSGRLPPTHFARLVVIERQLPDPHLLFSSHFDGPPERYLRALAATPEALEIWGHCDLGDEFEPLDAAALERYLLALGRSLPSQYVVNAVPAGLTVAEVNAALALREDLSRFATRAAARDGTALAHDFRQLPSIRRLLGRT